MYDQLLHDIVEYWCWIDKLSDKVKLSSGKEVAGHDSTNNLI